MANNEKVRVYRRGTNPTREKKEEVEFRQDKRDSSLCNLKGKAFSLVTNKPTNH